MLLMFRNAEQRREGETNTRRESIVFYRSFFEAIRLQPKRIQAEIYNALLDYAFNGEEPDIGTAAMSIFYLIRPQIDANNMKYENGKKGGRPRKTEKSEKADSGKTGGGKTGGEESGGCQEDGNIKTGGFENTAETGAGKKPNEECRMSNEECKMNNEECGMNNEECKMSNEKMENEKNGAKAPEKKSGASAPVYFPLDRELDEAFRGFIDMRERIKKPMTERAVEMMINKIKSIGDNNRAIECLNESTLHCWQTIYPERERAKAEKSGNPFMDIYNEMKEAER